MNFFYNFFIKLTALTLLITFSPIMIILSLLIFLSDFHNPFYVAIRIGKGNKVFKMLKFRSMVINYKDYNAGSTSDNDPRITFIGKFIRNLKLDELPSLINILKGEMAFVGPRPQIEAEVSRYTEEEMKMLTIKPGITDISSIVFSDEGKILANSKNPDLLYNQIERPWKSRLALLYIKYMTPLNDIKIMFFTLTIFLNRQWTLNKLSNMVSKWNCDVEFLPEIVSRTKNLFPYPPPGSDTIVDKL